MARQKSVLRIEGPLNGLSFYLLNGVWVVRRTRGHTKEEVAKLPGFAPTRENNAEFGVSARMAKLLRMAWKEAVPELKHYALSGRLTGLLRQVMLKDTTHGRGQRSLLAEGCLMGLKGFEANPEQGFAQLYRGRLETERDNTDCVGSLVLEVNPFEQLKTPAGASHVRFVYSICALGDVVYDVKGKVYTTTAGEVHGRNGHSSSEWIDVGRKEKLGIRLEAGLAELATLPEGMGLVQAVGLVFGRMETRGTEVKGMGGSLRVLG